MKKSIIFMFSGQGSQYHQMGKELYENHSRFRYWLNHCDALVEPMIGTSLIQQLYRTGSRSTPFDRLLYTNPALLSIEVCLAKILQEAGCHPDYLMGYSLGEITASVVSDALELEEGLLLTVDLAKKVEKKCSLAEMMVVMSPLEVIDELPELFQQCHVTGNNFSDNFVVSGFPESMQRLKQALDARRVLTQILPLKYGFHTGAIDIIKDDFKFLIDKMNIRPFSIPVISTMRAAQVTQIDTSYYWDALRQPVKFHQTVEWMIRQGDYLFIDVGPSGSLATFVKYILPPDSQSFPLSMMNPFGRDIDSLNKLFTQLRLGTEKHEIV